MSELTAYKKGLIAGRKERYTDSYDQGFGDGYTTIEISEWMKMVGDLKNDLKDAYDCGYKRGFESGKSTESPSPGGFYFGYRKGYDKGYNHGLEDAKVEEA